MSSRRSLARDARGVVLLEFVIALLPVLVLFLSALQLALLGAARLVVEHAAIAAARSAAVVLDDDPARYGEPCGAITGERLHAIERAVIHVLGALPELPGEHARLTFPMLPSADTAASEQLETADTVTVRVEHLAACMVPLARALTCPTVTLADGTTTVRALRLHAEATMSRFAARYLCASERSGDGGP